MWSLNNLVSQSEAAKEHLASVFQKNKETSQQSNFNNGTSGGNNNDTQQQTNANANANEGGAEEETESEELGSRATIASIPPKKAKASNASANPNNPINNVNMNWNSFRSGFGNVLSATQKATQEAMTNIETHQSKISQTFASIQQTLPPLQLNKKDPYKRDLSLPLDTESLKDAEVVYITDRIITLSHPALQSPVDGSITPHRKLAAVAHLLQKRHNGKYMVWNLSELEYDYSVLDDQVMTFEFPGSPSPPLGMWMKILMGMESWLKADDKNVAVMHCLTGRGRTSTVLAAFLCWMREASFVNPHKALSYLAQCKKLDLETLTIPSQRRYVGYFTNMLDGVKPSQPPLLLKRIIMSEAPKYEKYQPMEPKIEDDTTDPSSTSAPVPVPDPLAAYAGTQGCAPYLQIFKAGKLVFTTAASKSFHQSKDDLPFCFPSEKSITFPIETVVQGDILIRCRHLTKKGKRVSMFRIAMHTGYIPPKVMRLKKEEIDGACSDKAGRYADDFFLDLVFEECPASMASKHLLSVGAADTDPDADRDGGIGGGSNDDGKGGDVTNEASMRRMAATVSGSSAGAGAVTGTAFAYDSMLHRDSRFWDAIAQRREECNKKASSDENGDGDRDARDSSVFYGPTIGRRREFPEERSSKSSGNSGSDSGNGSGTFSVSSQQTALESFTIGGELDFTLDSGKDASGKVDQSTKAVKDVPGDSADKKDDLMDALMAIDDGLDDDDDDDEIEIEIVEDLQPTDMKMSAQETTEKEVVAEHLDSILTEEIVFDDNTDAPSSSITPTIATASDNIFNTTKTTEDKQIPEARIESVSVPAPVAKTEPEKKTAQENFTGAEEVDDILDLNNLDLDAVVGSAGVAANDDEEIDFSDDDDDDDELADLEEFLMKATS